MENLLDAKLLGTLVVFVLILFALFYFTGTRVTPNTTPVTTPTA